MKKTEMKMKKRAAALFLAMAILVTGCARSSETVHRETVTNPASSSSVVVSENTTTTKVEDHSHRGVLGSTFHVIGEIIAFPFELIANVFRFIF